ncbi:ciliogenesis-associated TTC17-interacting protein isoform X3 [Dermochelys coriacea]|uniref:ciliogenesis-associated TTC17-interacting protein isoform X3 n=1 Tax=Dermochelys coriacea TaxID=27794 RepID=UPI001CA92BB5|nr:ciliogenesis-associated TTC17-interacting protein isoform X3 [Dermochelys coriacea]
MDDADSPALVQRVLAASEGATEFLSLIGEEELSPCLFAESLVMVSESGQPLGQFSVSVQPACYEEQGGQEEDCYLVRATSQSTIDEVPCGSSITAYISKRLETLEQHQHEYVKFRAHPLDRKTHVVKRGGRLVVTKIIEEGETAMGFQKQLVGMTEVEVFGIERAVCPDEGIPMTWQFYFLSDGHLARRVQVGSPATVLLQQLPVLIDVDEVEPRPVFEKKSLDWEEDVQLYSQFLDRKEELQAGHASYARRHPELRALLADFLQLLLLRKPDDVFTFAAEFFAPFATQRPPGSTFQASDKPSPFRGRV